MACGMGSICRSTYDTVQAGSACKVRDVELVNGECIASYRTIPRSRHCARQDLFISLFSFVIASLRFQFLSAVIVVQVHLHLSPSKSVSISFFVGRLRQTAEEVRIAALLVGHRRLSGILPTISSTRSFIGEASAGKCTCIDQTETGGSHKI